MVIAWCMGVRRTGSHESRVAERAIKIISEEHQQHKRQLIHGISRRRLAQLPGWRDDCSSRPWAAVLSSGRLLMRPLAFGGCLAAPDALAVGQAGEFAGDLLAFGFVVAADSPR